MAAGVLWANRRHEPASLDHLVRAQQECLGNIERDCFGGLEVDHEPIFRRELDRQLAYLGAALAAAEKILEGTVRGKVPPTTSSPRGSTICARCRGSSVFRPCTRTSDAYAPDVCFT